MNKMERNGIFFLTFVKALEEHRVFRNFKPLFVALDVSFYSSRFLSFSRENRFGRQLVSVWQDWFSSSLAGVLPVTSNLTRERKSLECNQWALLSFRSYGTFVWPHAGDEDPE